jgi:hypothetical protein
MGTAHRYDVSLPKILAALEDPHCYARARTRALRPAGSRERL